jgi:hypothetical protein
MNNQSDPIREWTDLDNKLFKLVRPYVNEDSLAVAIVKELEDNFIDQQMLEAQKGTATPCGYCGKPVDDAVTVTPKYYCSHSHRQLAYKIREASKDKKGSLHAD